VNCVARLSLRHCGLLVIGEIATVELLLVASAGEGDRLSLSLSLLLEKIPAARLLIDGQD
jgi:hypothetical protein